jgi:predicted acetyltransferase
MIHGVATVPEARRRGIGTAVTLAALLAARRLGYRIAVLQASSIGQGPYARLGFRFVAGYGRFVRQPAVEGANESGGQATHREAAGSAGEEQAA